MQLCLVYLEHLALATTKHSNKGISFATNNILSSQEIEQSQDKITRNIKKKMLLYVVLINASFLIN